MAGNREGGLRARDTNKQLYGEDYYSVVGRMGGSKKTSKPKGFAKNRDLAREAGAKGGRAPRRKV